MALAALAIGLLAAPASAAPVVDGEFDVPGLGSNNKLTQGPEGNMWVTLDGVGRDVAKVTPAGAVEEFDLDAVTPSGIAVGPENRIWITRNGGVISFDPANPAGTKDPTDIASIGNEHSIVLGPDGNLWVATTDKLVKVPPAAPLTATEVAVPGLKPKDIDTAGSLLVVADLERILASTTGGTTTEFKVSGQAQGVAGGPDGQYAFTQPVNPPKEIGLLSPTAAPLVLSAEGTDPFGITLGADGAYWSPEFVSDGLTRLTTDGQLSGLTGFATGSGPRQIAAGPGNTLWVTLEMAKKVGRVSGVDPPPPSQLLTPPPPKEPRTKIRKGPKGKVKTRRRRAAVRFTFTSPDAGARFECALTKLRKGKGKGKGQGKGRGGERAKPSAKATPRFAPCKSPRTYRLKPGRYRFQVRAVLDGVADRSPAQRTFRVVRVAR